MSRGAENRGTEQEQRNRAGAEELNKNKTSRSRRAEQEQRNWAGAEELSKNRETEQ
jgi:hypothetical protein